MANQQEQQGGNKEVARPIEQPASASEVDAACASIKHAVTVLISQRVERDQQLARRRESKELSPYDFDLNYLFSLQQADQPLTRNDLQHQTGLQAVVLTADDLEQLGGFDLIDARGRCIRIDPECLAAGAKLIIFPEDLGNKEGEPMM